MSTPSPASSTAAQLQSLGDVQLYGPDGKKLDLSQEDRIGFSPGMPQAPVITQRGYPPWEWERPVGWNLMWTPRGESTTKGTTKSFAELRALAQWCTEARIAIEIQKKKIRGLAWSFVPLEDSWSKSAREKYRKQVDAARTWWRRPNKIDDVNFSAWLGQVVEEMYVTDACVLYKQRTFGGALDSLVQLDGATIKIDIDNFGHVLQYRQMIYGRPVTAYAPSDLAYVVFNPRVDQVYGTSPLEEIAPVIQTAVKRQLSHLSYYTEGNVPMATLGVPSDWPVKRIREIQTYLDETFSGDDRLRHKVRAIPMTPGNRSGGVLQQLRPFEFNQAEHEALMTLIAVHFGVSPAQFRSQTGIGGGSLAEAQNDEAADVGQAPLRKHLAEFITEVTQSDLGLDGIKFVWDDSRASTDTVRAQSLALQIQAGILTVNEARAELGMEPLAENQAVAVPAAAVKEEAKPEVPGAEAAAEEEQPEPEEQVVKANPYREPTGGRFAPNDYPGGPVATARLAALPEEPTVPVGLEPADTEGVAAAVAAMGNDEFQRRAMTAEPEPVRVADLHPMRGWVLREKLARFTGAEVDEPVTVVRHEGRMFLHDGHHRVAAAVLRGVKEVSAKVVDVGDIQKWDEDQPRDEAGRFVAVAQEASKAANEASRKAGKATPMHGLYPLGEQGSGGKMSEGHYRQSLNHEFAARGARNEGDKKAAKLHDEAARLHAVAAERHSEAVKAGEAKPKPYKPLRQRGSAGTGLGKTDDPLRYRGLAGVPEDALRSAIGKSLPAGDLTASPDRAEVERLLGPDDALVEFSGEGDHIVILGVDREGDRLVVRGRSSSVLVWGAGSEFVGALLGRPHPDLAKENPYRDEQGRFASAPSGGASVTVHPGLSSVAERVGAHVARLNAEYGDIIVGVTPTPEAFPDQLGSHHRTAEGQQLSLNPKYANDPAFWEARAKEWDGLMIDPSLEGTITHEYGHALFAAARRKDIDEYNRTVTPLTRGGDHAASAYGQENDSEMEAEAFAAVHAGRAALGPPDSEMNRRAMERSRELVAAARAILAKPEPQPRSGKRVRKDDVHPDLAKWRRFALAPDRVRRRRWADPFETDMPRAEQIRARLAKAETVEEVQEIFEVDHEITDDSDPSSMLNRWRRGGDPLAVVQQPIQKVYDEDDHPRDEAGRWIPSGTVTPTKALGAPGGGFEERVRASQERLISSGLSAQAAKSATDAIARYTHHSYDINDALSSGARLTEEQSRVVDGLSVYLSATTPVTREVYRGAGFPSAEAAAMQPGAEVTTRSFWSASTSEKVAKQFAIPMAGESFDPERRITRLVVTVEPPHSAVSISEASGKPVEREALFRPGVRFRVVSRDGNRVRMREIRGTTHKISYGGNAPLAGPVSTTTIAKSWEDQPRDELGRFADATGGAAVAGGDRFTRPQGIWDRMRTASRLRTEAMAHRREGRGLEAKFSEEAAADHERAAAAMMGAGPARQPVLEPPGQKWDKVSRYGREPVMHDPDEVTRAGVDIFGDGNLPTVKSLEQTWGDATSGLKVRLSSVTGEETYSGGARMTCRGKLVMEGREVGSLERSFYKHADGASEVHHDYFVIDDDRGLSKGAGAAMMRQSIEAYADAGIDKVTVGPAWLGRYVWATFGYDMSRPAIATMRDRFKEYLRQKGYDSERAGRVAAKMQHSWDFADYDDGTKHSAEVSVGPAKTKVVDDMHLGKAFMLQTHWPSGGTIDLKDKRSPSYLRAKKRLKLRGTN